MVSKSAVLVSLFLFVFISSHALAQDKRVISLDEAVSMALGSNEGLKMAENGIKLGESNIAKAMRELYPQAAASFSWNRNFEYPGSYPPIFMNG